MYDDFFTTNRYLNHLFVVVEVEVTFNDFRLCADVFRMYIKKLYSNRPNLTAMMHRDIAHI